MNDEWDYQMEVLNKRKRIIEIAETIDRVLWEWYSERGRDVPHWKQNFNQDWLIENKKELDNEENNFL